MEEKLIAPEYSENYLGRRAFFFSEKDVRTLRDIAVLRKIGFSISDIRAIQNDPQQSAGIIDGLRRRIEAAVAEKQACLDALNTLDEHGAYTLSDLASALQRPVEKTPLPQEDSRVTLRSALRRFGSIILNAVRVILIAGILFIPFVWLSRLGWGECLYPHMEDPWYSIAVLLPAMVMLLMLIIDHVFFEIKGRIKLIVYGLVILICIIWMYMSLGVMMLIPPESMTTRIQDYRTLDADCTAIGDPFYEALFPAYPRGENWPISQSAARYLYRQNVTRGKRIQWGKTEYSGDVVETIYAEWALAPDQFEKEVARANALFAVYSNDKNGFQQDTVERGDWVILFRYQGNGPFIEETNRSYRYYLFAYRMEDRCVRYLFCNFRGEEPYYGKERPEQPYYLKLDW